MKKYMHHQSLQDYFVSVSLRRIDKMEEKEMLESVKLRRRIALIKTPENRNAEDWTIIHEGLKKDISEAVKEYKEERECLN